MTHFERGIRLYVSVLAFVSLTTVVWGTNRFVLGNTTNGTGWPLMIGIAVSVLLFVLLIRRGTVESDERDSSDDYPW